MLDVWVEEGLLSMEVTLQESTAANPEYVDFHCAMRLAAAAFCVFGGSVSVLNQFIDLLLTFTHTHTKQ